MQFYIKLDNGNMTQKKLKCFMTVTKQNSWEIVFYLILYRI